MKFSSKVIFFSAIVCSATTSLAQGDPDTINRIVDQGKNHSQIMMRLHHLTKDIGPRLTSSPRLAKAQQWAMGEFKKMGCTNAHLEQWGEAPVGWDRGP